MNGCKQVSRTIISAVLLTLSLLLSACGGGGSDSESNSGALESSGNNGSGSGETGNNNGSNGTGNGSVGGGDAGTGDNVVENTNPGAGGTSGGGNGSTVSNGITGGEILVRPSGDPVSPEGGSLGSIRGALSAADFTNQFSAPLDRQSIAPDTIAYVSTINGALPRTIRLMQSDGSQDRELFALADDSASNAFVTGLDWRPDGTELALYSNFELSIWNSDIYALTAGGDNLRRLSNVPRPIAYANFPQGRAELTALNADLDGRLIGAYIEGSQQAFSWLAPSLEQRVIDFPLADFGPGIQQISRVNNDITDCWFDLAANIDVAAGETQVIPQKLPPSSVTSDEICPTAFFPQWSSDGNLYFVRLTRLDRGSLNSIDYVYSVMRTATDSLQPQNRGARLFAVGDGTFGQPNGFNNIDNMNVFRLNPAAGSDQVVFSETSKLFTDRIFLTNLNNPQNLTQLTAAMPNCGGLREPDCTVNDIQWLPNQAGFIYSLVLDPDNTSSIDPKSAQLRQYTEVNGVAEDRLLFELPDGLLGDFSIAPDGQQLVIEAEGDQVGFTDLYLYDIVNNNLSLLVKNAASPAWSPL